VILRITALLVGLGTGLVSAQDPVSPDMAVGSQSRQQPASPALPGGKLTLEQALNLAEQYSPQLRYAQARREGAGAGITTARAYPNPEVNAMGGPQFARAIPTPAVPGPLQHYHINQYIDLPSVRNPRIKAAEYGRDSSELGLRDTRLIVRADVKHNFYNVLRRKEEVEHAQENLRLVEDFRRRIEVQVSVGEAAKLELIRADAEMATARTLVKSAQLQYVTAISALRAVISAPLPDNLEPEGSLDPAANLPPLEQLRKTVLARNPGVAQSEAEMQRAESVLKTETALRRPQPTFYAEYEHQPDLYFYRAGLTLTIPVWNQRQGPIAEAKALVTQASALASRRRIELTAMLERAYGQYEIAGQQIVALESGALKQAEAAVAAAQAAYKFGERGVIEVLDAQRVLRSVRADLLDAQFAREAALIDLEQLRAIEIGRNQP
jgi:outer membrane protein, heavy metal efflux system